ncbi:MAG TPA: 50S ribosomal protein L6 [Pirellulales bacterium]|jgi:large subunit ribosomal protein L6|nr:50S ribosomal protein L6 [Pirellulales bacterium]
MSRIGKQPVVVPSGVKVALADNQVSIEGPQGKLSWKYHPELAMKYDETAKQIVISRLAENRQSRALHGLGRALVQNMVVGVTKGYEKKLEIVGVGYLAAVQKGELQLRVGFANEVHMPIPKGLTVTCPDQTHVVVKGADKQMVGQFAAEVRSVRKPEPYKGKGIRYDNEVVRRKAGKAMTK